MQIFPAIDLRGGQVVRLAEGDYGRMTVYSADPAATAEGFKAQGATNLHVVDLDGAKEGAQVNFSAIEQIVRAGGLFVEVGGGARDEASVRRYLGLGIGRVIVGTMAVENPALMERLAGLYPGKIAAGVDARDGFVAIRGWKQLTDIRSVDFMRKLPSMGVNTAIYTDIGKDGLLGGANLAVYRELAAIEGLSVIASGGISFEDELVKLKDMGIHGAIIGKALYAGKLDLRRAIEIART